MASDDLTTKFQDELDCLRSRVKDLETDNAKLVAQLSNCRCRQPVKEIDGNASGKLVGKRRDQKPEAVRHLNTIHHRSKRYVALSVMYFGKRFYGFASEAQMEPTVESEIFKALEKTRLLVGGRKESQYSRCGRTDRGVSAVGQVIALYLRSNLKETGDKGLTSEEEIDYVRLLNRVLPNDIRIIGWCLAPVDFHARFSCLSREYKYFFWSENLNLSVMQTAGVKFLGEHDFRNFCKMDAMNVHNYMRHVTSFEVIPCPQRNMEKIVFTRLFTRVHQEHDHNDTISNIERTISLILSRFESNELCAIKIRGSAFLWHQVRCMAAVLLMIGRGLESPDIIDALLDIKKTPRKPQYNMASEIPLVLHSCEFENIQFIISPDARQALQSHLKTECQSQMLQVALFQEALHSSSTASDGGRSPKHGQMKKHSHIPLMSRAVEPSYVERRAKLNSGILKKDISGLSLAVGTTEEG